MENNLYFPGEGKRKRILGETTSEVNTTGDNMIVPVVDTKLGTTYHIRASQLANQSEELIADQGYFGILTAFFFNGNPTETTITTAEENTWVDVNLIPFDNGGNEGTFDYRPQSMKDAQGSAYNEATGVFTLEGLTIQSFLTFEASFGFIPDIDECQIEVRLLFQRHSGTSPSDDFEKTGNVIPLTQGADIEYSLQPLITAFIGDTIDTNGVGDSGTCKFQVKSSSAGVVRMKQLTWYLNK